MKKFLLIVMAILMTAGVSYAGGGRGGYGGGGGCGRGGNTYNYYGGRGCGRGWYNGNAFWGSFAGAAAGSLVAGVITAPQPQVIVQEVVPVARTVYPLPGIQYRKYYINGVLYYEAIPRNVVCPNCRNTVNCDNIPPTSNAQCPFCGNILF